MKKLLKAASVLAIVLLTANLAQAQSKVAYVNFGDVMRLMPESKTVETQMAAYQKQWTDQLQALREEYAKKLKEYQDGEKTMSDAVKAGKQTDLQNLQKRFQDLSANAESAVDAKSAEFTKPLIDKVRAAVSAVAKEKGYSYVFNSNETDLIVAPDGDNILAAVKTKLGLK